MKIFKMSYLIRSIIKYILIAITIFSENILSLNNENISDIIDLRSGPLKIIRKEELIKVNLSMPDNSRILAYADFNNDK